MVDTVPTNVNISGIDERAKAVLDNLSWAKEVTLEKIVNNSNISAKLLGKIASVAGVDEKSIKYLIRGLDKASKDSVKAASEASDRVEKRDVTRADRFEKAMLSVRGSLSKNYQTLMTDHSTQVGRIFVDIGGQLRTFGERFGLLGGAVIGGLGLMVTAFGKAANIVQDVNNVLREMYAAGVMPVGGFNALADSAIATGLTLRGFAETISKFGAVAVTLGTRRVMEMQVQFARLTRRGADFMMNQEEAQTAFLESLEMMRSSNELTSLNQDQIVARGRTTISMFEQLSLATGRNRDELRRSTASLLNQTRIYGLQRAVGPNDLVRRLMANISSEFGAQSGVISSIIEGMFMGGPALVDDALKPIFAVVPGLGDSLTNITNGLRDGSINVEEATRRTSAAFANISDDQMAAIRRSLPALYDQIQAFRQSSQAAIDARNAIANMTAEERAAYTAQQEQDKRRQESMNALQTGLRAISTGISGLLMDLAEPLIPLFTNLGNNITGVVEAMREQLRPYMVRFATWIQSTFEGGIGPVIENVLTAVGSVMNPLLSVNWSELGSNLAAFARGIGSVVNAAGWVSRQTGGIGNAVLDTIVPGRYARRRGEELIEEQRAQQASTTPAAAASTTTPRSHATEVLSTPPSTSPTVRPTIPSTQVPQATDAARDRIRSVFGGDAPPSTNRPISQETAIPVQPNMAPNPQTVAPTVRNPTPIVPVTAPTNSAPATGPVPTITTDQLNLRTVRYYDESLQKFTQMAAALERSNDLLDRLDRSADGNTNRVVGAVESISGRIR